MEISKYSRGCTFFEWFFRLDGVAEIDVGLVAVWRIRDRRVGDAM